MKLTTHDFLPSGYEQPKGNSSYMKFLKGDNKFRILSKPIIGWLDWEDKKPIRFTMDMKPKTSIDPKKPVKHFWAFVVWNYQAEAINILEVTQSSIQEAIGTLAKDEDWGAPYGYDIKVIRTGDNMETKYSVNPSPHKPLADEIYKAYTDRPVDLEKLYDGQDPFNPDQNVTPMEISEPF